MFEGKIIAQMFAFVIHFIQLCHVVWFFPVLVHATRWHTATTTQQPQHERVANTANSTKGKWLG
jgi:hypothetical protein